MKRRGSPRIANSKQKKQTRCAEALMDSPAGRLGFVLELIAGQVCAFLLTEEILYLFEVCSSGLSEDFIDKLALKALDQFADENKTHVGRQCDCDWMRSIHFERYCLEKCPRTGPFTVNRAMPSLTAPNGALALWSALALAKRAMLPLFSVKNWHTTGALLPVVCLLTEDGEKLCSELAVKKAMNRVCKKAGDRFVYKYSTQQPKDDKKRPDLIYDHWDSIEGPKCAYCDAFIDRQRVDPRQFTQPNLRIPLMRVNCRRLYQPLKAAMEKELQFVRYIPQPKFSTTYKGLIAGISPSGVFCGFYIASEFWPYDRFLREIT
ncbi:unnamed protein product [Peronospora effusa]|nr:unnamed protein product [Peronospora effusa]